MIAHRGVQPPIANLLARLSLLSSFGPDVCEYNTTESLSATVGSGVSVPGFPDARNHTGVCSTGNFAEHSSCLYPQQPACVVLPGVVSWAGVLEL